MAVDDDDAFEFTKAVTDERFRLCSYQYWNYFHTKQDVSMRSDGYWRVATVS